MGGGGVNHVKLTQARTNPTPINIKREKPDPTHNNNNNNNDNNNNRATMTEIEEICMLGSVRILRKVLSV